jgi:hypothetical protein
MGPAEKFLFFVSMPHFFRKLYPGLADEPFNPSFDWLGLDSLPAMV